MNSSGSHVHNSAHHGKTITRQRSREAFYQHKMPHNANVPKHKTGRSAHHGAFTLASHGGGHHAAGHLVERMYSRRGLNISAHRDDHIDPNRLVITAGTEEQVFGTMTLGFDHAEDCLPRPATLSRSTLCEAGGSDLRNHPACDRCEHRLEADPCGTVPARPYP